jgi:four helix bundle protein
LTDAEGGQQETQHWIEIALNCSHLNPEKAADISHQNNTVGKMLNSMIQKAPMFCNASTMS